LRNLTALILVLLTAGSAFACPRHNSKRSNVRACFANQKTVVGAIEMYNLDRNCRVDDHIRRGDPREAYLTAPTATCGSRIHGEKPATGVEALPIPQVLWDALVMGGYLQSIPQDPSHGKNSHAHYLMVSWGNGIFCTRHGEIQPPRPGMSPLTQLVAAGYDPARSPVPVSDLDPLHQPWYETVPDELAILFGMLAGFVWVMSRARGERSALGLFAGAIVWGGLWGFFAVPMAVVGFGSLAMAGVASQMGAAGAAMVIGLGRAIGMMIPRAAAVVHTARHTPVQPRQLTDSAGLRCAVCATDRGPDGWVTCPACEAAHHAECWTFQDGCAAFGCTLAHGRWRSGKALPVRTVNQAEPQKPRGVNWVE
jgi:hypothetical protein